MQARLGATCLRPGWLLCVGRQLGSPKPCPAWFVEAPHWASNRPGLRGFCSATSEQKSSAGAKKEEKPSGARALGSKPKSSDSGAKKTKKKDDPIEDLEEELEEDLKLPPVRKSARSEIARSIAEKESKAPAPKLPTTLLEPEELTTPNFKAQKLRKKKEYDEAVDMLQELVTKRESTLGPEDPMTISAMNELAITFSEMDRHTDAAVWYRKVLKGILKKHGVRKSLSTRKALARELMVSSRKAIEEAETLLEDLLADMEQKFTAEHPETVDTRKTLAIALRMQGKIEEAGEVLKGQAEEEEEGAAFPT